MLDYEAIFDQISHTFLNQFVVLDQNAQILRTRLTAETSLDDCLALTRAIVEINQTLLTWSQYILPSRSGPVVCPACAADAEEEG